MRQAATFVPAAVASSWATVGDGVSAAVAALGKPGAEIEAVSAMYDDPAFLKAEAAVDSWAEANCA
jgi:hypothetical protein